MFCRKKYGSWVECSWSATTAIAIIKYIALDLQMPTKKGQKMEQKSFLQNASIQCWTIIRIANANCKAMNILMLCSMLIWSCREDKKDKFPIAYLSHFCICFITQDVTFGKKIISTSQYFTVQTFRSLEMRTKWIFHHEPCNQCYHFQGPKLLWCSDSSVKGWKKIIIFNIPSLDKGNIFLFVWSHWRYVTRNRKTNNWQWKLYKLKKNQTNKYLTKVESTIKRYGYM